MTYVEKKSFTNLELAQLQSQLTILYSGSIGSIEYFIQLDKAYAYVRKYSVLETYKHLRQIQPSHTETHQMIACDSIRMKLINLKFIDSDVSFMEIVTSEPNHVECN